MGEGLGMRPNSYSGACHKLHTNKKDTSRFKSAPRVQKAKIRVESVKAGSNFKKPLPAKLVSGKNKNHA